MSEPRSRPPWALENHYEELRGLHQRDLFHRYAGPHGRVVSTKRFGASAPGAEALERFGITPEHIVRAALESLERKSNMVVPGAAAVPQATVDEVADATLRVLRRTVPAAVPGIAFPVRRPVARACDRAPAGAGGARAAPVAANVLLRPCPPGPGAGGMEPRQRAHGRGPRGAAGAGPRRRLGA